MVLKTTNLSKRYGNLRAVEKLSFSVQKGEVLGIVGPNGSGKTTLFSMLLNLIQPTSGSVKILGETNLERIKKQVGATLDISFFYPYLNAYDHLKIVAKIKKVPHKKIKEKLQLVGLWGRHTDAVKGYSMGMKQRLAIAVALLNDPQLIILDEPTNGLDPKGIMDVRQIIQQTAKSGATILVSSHILSEIEKTCTRILMLEKGKLIQEIGNQQMLVGKGKEAVGSVFEIGSSQVERLKVLLESSGLVATIAPKADRFLVDMTERDTDILMRYLADNEVFVNHFVQQKTNLEALFLGEKNKLK